VGQVALIDWKDVCYVGITNLPINVEVGRNFNVISEEADNPDYMWHYVPNNDPITLIKETGAPGGPPMAIGSGGYLISTFQATQTGSFKVQFDNMSKTKPIYYIINVN